MSLRRSVLPVVLVALGVLTACTSTPPAKRVALEIVDTLDVSEEVKACMLAEIEEYGESQLDEIAQLADQGDVRGLEQLDEFQAALERCR